MTTLNALERKILAALTRADKGLDAFTLFTRFRCSPSQLFQVARRLERRDLVKVEASRISMTLKGQEWAMMRGIELANQGERSWRKVPEEFRRPVLSPAYPYVPRTSRVHRTILPASWKVAKR